MRSSGAARSSGSELPVTLTPRLPDTVDGIFVGGGHNSLVAAAYLARCGLDVLVLEANQRLGGGVTTEEVTLPLFRHNLHAFFVRWTPGYKVWHDLDLGAHGVEAIEPEVQNAVPFGEGRQALLTYTDLNRSLAAIRALSEADAERYAMLHREFTELVTRIEGPSRFAPPVARGELTERLERSRLGRRYLELTRRSAMEVIFEAFESEPLRALIGFNVAVRGYLPVFDTPGTGYCAVLALPNSHQGRMIRGGSYEMARAITLALYAGGGRAAARARVGAIEVRDGRAVGVEVTDGQRVRARRFVASSIPADQTLLELVGKAHLDSSLVADLEALEGLEEGLFGVHYALARRPRFAAEDRHPEVPRALNLALGYESGDDLLADMEAIRRREVSARTGVHASIPTANDRSQAPVDAQTTFGWQFVAAREPDGSDRVWGAEDAARQTGRITDLFTHYAPDFDDCVLGVEAHTPTDTGELLTSMPRGDRHHGSYHPDNWGDGRPHPALADCRTPIDGLYLCGASQHPGGSFTGNPGFVAAGIVADDLGIEPWWDRPDLPALLEALE